MSATSIFRAGCLCTAIVALVGVAGRWGTDGDAQSARTSLASSSFIVSDRPVAKWAALRRSRAADREPVATPTTEKQLVRDGSSALTRLADRFYSAAAARDAAAALQAASEHRAALDRAAADRRADAEREAANLAWRSAAARRAPQVAPSQPAATQPMPTTTVPPPAPAPAPTSPPIVSSGGGLAAVRGITVDASIASNLGALLSSADAAGISLAGAGYRDPAAQRRLRELHCPDPVSSPPSACTPTTAKPGQSMHEKGLAIDFTSGGAILSRSSAAFQWLAANAGRFGFQNLPSEPWHWSVNGQ